MMKQFYINNSILYKSFVCTQFECQIVLFNPLIGLYQVLPIWARVDRAVMAMKGLSKLPKLQHYWSLTIRLFSIILEIFVGVCVCVGVYSFADAIGIFNRPS